MSEPIHVLQVLGRLNSGGVESRQMDLLRNIDREKVQFDFMIHTKEHCFYEDEAKALGANIYNVPRFNFINIFQYKKAWKDFFEKHPEIKIVHGHMTSTAGIYLPIAKKYGKYTIAHVRSAGVDKGLKGTLTKLLRTNLVDKCDQAIACSKLAAASAYGQKAFKEGRVMIYNNAIDTERFAFNPKKRNEIRQSFGLSDEDYLIGHVGRLIPLKNHEYMLDILKECLKTDTNVKMMFVGEGELEEPLKAKTKELGIENNVIFAGSRKNVQDFYGAFDFFILPSFYEGLPGVAIEAQTSGLHGIISDKVTDECLITDLFTQISIDGPAANWAEEIMKHKKASRKSHVEEVKKAGFDVKEQVKWLEEYYENIVSSK